MVDVMHSTHSQSQRRSDLALVLVPVTQRCSNCPAMHFPCDTPSPDKRPRARAIRGIRMCLNVKGPGIQLGLDGPTLLPALAWCHWHTTAATPILLGENVANLPLGLYRWNLPGHFCQEIIVRPSDAGFSLIARERKLLLCTHKSKVQLCGSWQTMYEYLCTHLQSSFTSPSSCMLASAHDLRLEELHVAQCRNVFPRPQAQQPDWRYLLSDNEVRRVGVYDQLRCQRGLAMSPDVIYNLGDNPPHRVTWSCVSGSMPTYRRGNTKYWSESMLRWITPAEKLASMGWPVFQELAEAAGCTRLEIPRDVAARMVGNAVCLPNLGVALLAALVTCFDR
jgi:hypothetical protein